jgi:hypothetical protein
MRYRAIPRRPTFAAYLSLTNLTTSHKSRFIRMSTISCSIENPLRSDYLFFEGDWFTILQKIFRGTQDKFFSRAINMDAVIKSK